MRARSVVFVEPGAWEGRPLGERHLSSIAALPDDALTDAAHLSRTSRGMFGFPPPAM